MSSINLDDVNQNVYMSGVIPDYSFTAINTNTYTGTSTNYAWNTTSIDNTLQVQGDSDFAGDIRVQGRSLTEFMDSVEQRLNILRPNADLEADWDQLRELGKQYRELEQQILQKAQMWDTLKK